MSGSPVAHVLSTAVSRYLAQSVNTLKIHDYPARARVRLARPLRRLAYKWRRPARARPRAQGDLVVKIFVMLKNEDDLTLKWLKYHGSLVGYENLVVLDNGSDSPATTAALAWARERGVVVHSEFSTPVDFVKKGRIIERLIKQNDAKNPADFYLPLDCDEFVSVVTNDGVDCSRDALRAELIRHLDSPDPLLIHAGLDNNPHKPGWFRWSPGQRKIFFAANTCEFLDHGYHCGMSRLGTDPTRTRIVYIHYHFKPFDTLVEHSRAKLLPFTQDFSAANMEKYSKDPNRPGTHCAVHLVRTREEYQRLFDGPEYAEFPAVADKFRAVGETLPFS